MYRIRINIEEKNRIVRQVGYLQELKRDARSAKHKILSYEHKLTFFNVALCMLLHLLYNEHCGIYSKELFYYR
jgi:hypothetical protein